LANCLGLQTGLYQIEPDELNKATDINCHSLIPPVRRRQRTKRTSNTSRYIRSDQLVAASTEKAVDSRGQQHVAEADDAGAEPRYMIHPDLLDPSSSVIVHGLDGATAGHLVLVSENGELLLQCDAKDFPQLARDDAQPIVVEPAVDDDNCEHADTLYVAEEDNTDLSCDLKVLSACIS